MKGREASRPGEASALGMNTNKRQPGKWLCWSLFHSPPQSPLSLPTGGAQTLISKSWAHQPASPFLLLSLYPCNLAPARSAFSSVSPWVAPALQGPPTHLAILFWACQRPFPVGTTPGHSGLLGRAMPYLGQY